MRTTLFCMLTSVLLFPFSILNAQDMHAMHAMPQQTTAQAETYQSQGIVKKITPRALSIAHQPIPALNWPAMTMQFALPSGGNLPAVKVGDTVGFRFVQSENGYQIIALTPAE